MNILLIYPHYTYATVSTFAEPLGVLYLASALLKAGYNVNVADLTFNPDMKCLDEKIRWADLVGISAPTPLFGTADTVLQYVKKIKPDILSIVGGPHATANPFDALQAGFDIAVIGEGEATIVELAEALEQKKPLETVAGIAYLRDNEMKLTAMRSFIPDLDKISFPARQFIDCSRYRTLGIISMRGCPYRCLYCKPVEEKLFGKKLRKRSIDNVIQELDELIDRYGNRHINFKDDTLTVNKTEWFEKLEMHFKGRNIRLAWQCSSRVDTIDREKLQAMKKAGCRQIFFGIESGSQKILDYYRKDITVEKIIETFALCHRIGVHPSASIMMGAPMETREDLEKTYALVKLIKPFTWHVHVTTPICGSYLYEQALADKRLNIEKGYGDFAPTGNMYSLNLPMKLDNLSVSDIAEYRNRINRHMKFRVLLQSLVDPRIWKELLVSRRGTSCVY